jgi:hypothetical protein
MTSHSHNHQYAGRFETILTKRLMYERALLYVINSMSWRSDFFSQIYQFNIIEVNSTRNTSCFLFKDQQWSKYPLPKKDLRFLKRAIIKIITWKWILISEKETIVQHIARENVSEDQKWKGESPLWSTLGKYPAFSKYFENENIHEISGLFPWLWRF